jgi:DNA-binding protein H-NS
MMMMDITRIPLSELLRLQEQLPVEIERRRSLERDRVMEELSALARARGFVLEDLMEGKVVTEMSQIVAAPKPDSLPPSRPTAALFPQLPQGRKRRSPPVKYRHPQQCDLTWTGRGKRPRWVMAWLAEGRRIEELGVQ